MEKDMAVELYIASAILCSFGPLFAIAQTNILLSFFFNLLNTSRDKF